MIVGIDLGTTNSLIGMWKDGKVELIPNALGSVLTPSAVHIDESGQIHVGMAARERLVSQPARSIAAFKRYLGTGRKFNLAGREFDAVELSALVLHSLKEDAERHLQQSVTEAVVTVPAYFNDFQRQATKAAAELAGLKVDRLLNEPTAAALAYGMHEGEGEKKILVLDLGGGTFDVSILEMFEGIMEVRAAAGDNQLGGEDFTDLLVDAFIKEVGTMAGIPPRSQPVEIHGAIRRQMEIVKRELGEKMEADAVLIHEGRELTFRIGRERFEAMCEPLLARLRAPIERAVRDARLMPEEITHLVLAGGATRMRMVRQMAARLFRHLPASHINPDEAIACGAAIQAGLAMRDAALDDVVMTDVAPFTLGVSSSWRSPLGERISGVFSPIIERNTVIPASRSRRYSSTSDNQTSMTFKILQGESRMAEDNIEIGKFTVNLPPRPAGAESVEVRFTYDVSGLLEAEATNSLGQKFQVLIEGNAGALNAEEIAQRVAAFAELKIHPRDQAVNQAVLARAERLYEERLGDDRQVIGDSINLFRSTLNRQNTEEIEKHRQKFSNWLDHIDSSIFL